MIKGKNLLRWGENTICLALICFLSFLIYIMIQQEINGGETPSFGGYKLMIVLSGSMKPAFDTGALIVVKKVDSEGLKTGEIITFRDMDHTGRLITHRVVDVVKDQEQTYYVTKGDDNQTRDFSSVPSQNVIGKVTAAIPFIGYLVSFSSSRVGILLLLVIPVILAVIGEFRAVEQIFGRKKELKAEK